MNNKYDNLTLEQLENQSWNQPNKFPTTMVEDIFNARKIPLKQLSSNDIRILISQSIGLKYIVPYAFDVLEKNVLEDAMYFPGDLLLSVLNIDKSYWKNNGNQYQNFLELLSKNQLTIDNSLEINQEIKNDLKKAINSFFKLNNSL